MNVTYVPDQVLSSLNVTVKETLKIVMVTVVEQQKKMSVEYVTEKDSQKVLVIVKVV